MEAHNEEFGPVDIVVIAYPADAPMTGEAIPIVMDLVERGIIRVLDVLFVMQNEDGTVSGLRGPGPRGRQGRGLQGLRGGLDRPARRG